MYLLARIRQNQPMQPTTLSVGTSYPIGRENQTMNALYSTVGLVVPIFIIASRVV